MVDISFSGKVVKMSSVPRNLPTGLDVCPSRVHAKEEFLRHITGRVGSGRVGSDRLRRFLVLTDGVRPPLPDPTRPDLTSEV